MVYSIGGELYHHGVLGQKWGKRNGPPYPLSPGAHSASERKAGYKKSIGGGRNEAAYGRNRRSKSKSKVNLNKQGRLDSQSDSSVTKKVKNDYNNMDDNAFRGKYKVSKKEYAKRVEKYGDPYMNSPLAKAGKFLSGKGKKPDLNSQGKLHPQKEPTTAKQELKTGLKRTGASVAMALASNATGLAAAGASNPKVKVGMLAASNILNLGSKVTTLTAGYHYVKAGAKVIKGSDTNLNTQGSLMGKKSSSEPKILSISKSDSSVTKKVKNDYNNLDDKAFRGKYQVSKKEYAKRVEKYGDPYMNSPLAKAGKVLSGKGKKPSLNSQGSQNKSSSGKLEISKSDSSVTKKVKNDYNNLDDKAFRGKYQVSKKEYAKRVEKYGDPYMNSPLAKAGKVLSGKKASSNKKSGSSDRLSISKSDSSVTKKVKNDYNNLDDNAFRGKYQVSKKEYAKRVEKYGDPYMNSPLAKAGKRLSKKR